MDMAAAKRCAYDDCIYMDGVLYAVTATGGIDAFDLPGPTIS